MFGIETIKEKAIARLLYDRVVFVKQGRLLGVTDVTKSAMEASAISYTQCNKVSPGNICCFQSDRVCVLRASVWCGKCDLLSSPTHPS